MGGRSGAAGGHEPTSGRFEWDPAKSASNKEKHGVDFTEAQAIWQDGARIETDVVRTGEARLVTVAMMDGKMWTAVSTMRGDIVRIISVRRSRPEEVATYEQQWDSGL
jgi:uncharacterized DUF497 family protein